MKNVISIASAAVNSVRQGTNMARAMSIYVDEMSAPTSELSHRARCVARFQQELGQQETTASTYYALCGDKFLEQADQVSALVAKSSAPRKYTVFKTKPGTDTITARIVLPVKGDADKLCTGLSFTGVVKGVLDVGQHAPAA